MCFDPSFLEIVSTFINSMYAKNVQMKIEGRKKTRHCDFQENIQQYGFVKKNLKIMTEI